VIFKEENEQVGEAFANMSHGLMRDPAGDCDKVKTKLWTSPTTKKQREFEQHVSHSWFKLKPTKELPSKADENAFVHRTCTDIGLSMMRVLQTEAFAECHKAAIGNDNVWAAISKECSGYASFVKKARVAVALCENFNAHLTKTAACELSTVLYKNNAKEKKYPDDA